MPFDFVLIIYDDMDTQILDQAIEAYLADELEDSQLQEILAMVQKLIS